MRGAVPVHPEPAKSPSHPSPGVKFAASQAELFNSMRFEWLLEEIWDLQITLYIFMKNIEE